MSDFIGPIDQRDLDRMVDGELTDEEQQQILRRLEDTPDGWKDLALTFVEAQAMSRVLSAEVDAVVQRRNPVAARQAKAIAELHNGSTPHARRTTTAQWWIAAVLLITAGFGFGWQFRSDRIARMDDWRRDTGPNVPRNALTPNQIQKAMTGPQESVPFEGSDDDENVKVNPRYVRLVYNDGRSDVPISLDVPISETETEFSRLDELMSPKTSALPEKLLEMLRDSGQEFEQTRDLWPVSLPDGRAVVIPVNQVHFRNHDPIYP